MEGSSMLGDKVLYGYPRLQYFELFTEQKYSKKIYSVQTEDFPKDLPAVIYIPENNKEKAPREAANHNDHIFVILTPELEAFLNSRGVVSYAIKKTTDKRGIQLDENIENAAWVIKKAFDWKEPKEDDVIDNPDRNELSNKTKSLIFSAISVISLI